MNHKTVVVTVDVGGRIGLELNRHVRHGGEKFHPGLRSAVLSQDVCCEIITIIKRHHIILTKMKSENIKEIQLQETFTINPFHSHGEIFVLDELLCAASSEGCRFKLRCWALERGPKPSLLIK